MGKGKRLQKEKQGVIELGKGYVLIVPQHSSTQQLLVSIGILVSMYAQANKDFNKKETATNLKAMMNDYIDAIYSDDPDYLKKKVEEAKKNVQEWNSNTN